MGRTFQTVGAAWAKVLWQEGKPGESEGTEGGQGSWRKENDEEMTWECLGWGGVQRCNKEFCLDPKSDVDPPTHFKLGKRVQMSGISRFLVF